MVAGLNNLTHIGTELHAILSIHPQENLIISITIIISLAGSALKCPRIPGPICEMALLPANKPLHHSASHCTTVHHTASQCITLHHSASKCITVHQSEPQCITVHRTTKVLQRCARGIPMHSTTVCGMCRAMISTTVSVQLALMKNSGDSAAFALYSNNNKKHANLQG